MPDRIPQSEIHDGYRAILDAIKCHDAHRDLDRALIIIGYTVNHLLVAIKAEYRMVEALKWTSIILDNVHHDLMQHPTDDA